MGTSISHGSPRNSNWKPVLATYTDNKIPPERVISEVWRAFENDRIPISSYLKTDLIFSCFNAVKSSNTFIDALRKYNDSVLTSKHNTIIAEFAKRVIPLAFQSKNPLETWKTNLFSELTNYIISRDASGFVGEKFRNKSINDLIEFKDRINHQVTDIVGKQKISIANQEDWNSFIDTTIFKLKSTK